MVGRVLGHYRIQEEIGAGGMGVVCRAHDERLDRDVAVKVLPPGTLNDDASRKRFRKEALTLSRLNHPNIETVFDFDTQEGVDFLVMELIPGITLDLKLRAGPFPEKEVLRLGTQLAEGLAAAHAEGVIHRDLKPGNLRVTPDGRLKILDFGLAKLMPQAVGIAATASLSELHGLTGTLPYMAPEQLRNEPADARTDIWAAGAVLYELATGRRPFPQASGPMLTDAILHQEPPPPCTVNRSLTPALETILLKALDKEPDRRYQSARELRVDLERGDTRHVPTSAPMPARNRRRAALIVAAGVLLAALAVLVVRDQRPSPGKPELTRVESLAVLPLQNLSGDPQQEYFADGMTEALITGLSQISTLKVISRTSAMRYKGTSKPLPEVARELGVDAVVEGSVLRSGQRVRITAQLIHGETDRHLWAKSYERDLSDILALQGELSTTIAHEIQAKLTPQEQTRLAAARPVNPAAHEAYLQGRFQYNRFIPEGMSKSFEHYNEAIRLDPGYAPAYAGIAYSYTSLGFFGISPPRELLEKARAAAEKALALDDASVEAHIALAYAKLAGDWDWSGAENELRRALALNPGSQDAHFYYSIFLSARERHEEAISEAQRARELDPLSLLMNINMGWRYFQAGRLEPAELWFRRTLEMDARYDVARANLAQLYMQQGRNEEALAELKRLQLSGNPPAVLALLMQAHVARGRRAEALKMFSELQSRARRSYVPAFVLAHAYHVLGDEDRTFAYLDKAYDERDTWMIFLKVAPLFQSLRSHPRFVALAKRVGLPQ